MNWGKFVQMGAPLNSISGICSPSVLFLLLTPGASDANYFSFIVFTVFFFRIKQKILSVIRPSLEKNAYGSSIFSFSSTFSALRLNISKVAATMTVPFPYE